MPKAYETISTERRRQLIDLIQNKGLNITQAAKKLGIFYPTAKAIAKVFRTTGRIDKKVNRLRRNPVEEPGIEETNVADEPVDTWVTVQMRPELFENDDEESKDEPVRSENKLD